MVEVALHQRFGTVNMGLLPCQIVSHLLVGIAIAMTLLVSLVHHIDSPAVAKFVEIFAVGIMAGAQEVDVSLLHQADILFIGCIIHPAAGNRVMVVTVHTTQLHVSAVNLKHLTDNLHLLYAQMVVEVFNNRAVSITKLHTEGIEVGSLSRPEQRFVNGGSQFNSCRIANSQQLQSVFHLLAVK